jgi:transcriptional regulator with XRE-family HTH domain
MENFEPLEYLANINKSENGFDSKKFQESRKRLNLSQEQFAKLIGVSFSAVNFWENGKRNPDIKAIEMIRNFAKNYLPKLPATEVSSVVSINSAIVENTALLCRFFGEEPEEIARRAIALVYRLYDDRVMDDLEKVSNAKKCSVAALVLDLIKARCPKDRKSQHCQENKIGQFRKNDWKSLENRIASLHDHKKIKLEYPSSELKKLCQKSGKNIEELLMNGIEYFVRLVDNDIMYVIKEQSKIQGRSVPGLISQYLQEELREKQGLS